MRLRDLPGPIWMIGCGNMGGAMLRRWIAAGLDPAAVTVVTRSGFAVVPEEVRALATLPPGDPPAIMVLAVKPQQLGTVAPSLAATRPALLISILAGVEVDALARRTAAGAIVRAMPNLPVAVGQGVTVIYARNVDASVRDRVTAMMRPLGLVEWIESEARFDVMTALAGCGPGFVFRFIDALAEAAAALGIEPAQAARLALAVITDAKGIAREDAVSSTGSARAIIYDNDLIELMTETLAASARRNRELAEAARN